MLEREEPHEVLRRMCEKLADIIGLTSGSIHITITGRRAAKIEASKQVRVCCICRSGKKWGTPDGDRELQMGQAADYVTDHLEEKIVAAVGGFGFLEARLIDGVLTQLTVNSTFIPPRRRRKARR